MRHRPLGALLCAVATWPLIGCQLALGFKDFEASDNSTGGSANVACNGVAPSAEGTILLATPRQDGTCFWMDEHEVTQQQYAVFANGNPPGLSLPCSWNHDYYDSACEDASVRITHDPNHPQVCVDQCDAEAYCRSVNKTLCRSSFTGAAKRDDWGAACSNGGETPLPYGKSGKETACNVLGRGNETTTSVKANTSCQNDVGIRDLTGNVAEWTGGDDACEANSGADDACLIRGGSFADDFQNTNCDSSANPLRGATYDYVGFRCCSYDAE